MTMIVVSPDGKYVAFNTKVGPDLQGSIGVDTDIGILRLVEGAQPQWLCTGLNILSLPTWSPDGSLLAFTGWEINANTVHIVVYQIETRTSRLLTTRSGWVRDTYPEWSPTGDSIAFARSRPCELGLCHDFWIVAPDGTGVRQVTSGDLVKGIGGARWAPDGSKLYYIKQSPEASGGDVYMVDLDLRNEPEIRITEHLNCASIVLSPDGRHLLCSVYAPPATYENKSIYLVPVGEPASAVSLVEGSSAAAFSPDSNWIVFRDGTNSDLVKMHLFDRLDRTKLAEGVDGLAWRNAWTVRDQIVFTRDKYRSIWVVNADGTNEREIFRLRSRPEW